MLLKFFHDNLVVVKCRTVICLTLLTAVAICCIVQPHRPRLYFYQQKQIQTLNKLCSNLLEKLNNPRDDRDAESAGMLQFHSPDNSSQMYLNILTRFFFFFLSPSNTAEQTIFQPC